jgi:hypothetical protein
VPFELAPFASIPLTEDLLELLIAEHESITLPRLGRLWNYYRNALPDPDAAGRSTGLPAQWVGLPARLVGPATTPRTPTDDRFDREIVIENDIAWRVHTLVDFMFPASPRIVSDAPDPARREAIEAVLDAVIDASGGDGLWQNAALLGSVYGHVDFLLASDGPRHLSGNRDGRAPSRPDIRRAATLAAQSIRIETIEAPRAIPLLSPSDYRVLDAYILHFEQAEHEVDRGGMFDRLSRAITGRASVGRRRATVEVTEIHSATHVQRYEDGRLVHETVNRLGRLPVVHVQNLAQPLQYEGLSDVDPLIPLQDELNTRLSDRANRVTMQSFRMWLGKGIDSFDERPVGPGQMWTTDNPDASIEAFGGDNHSPSEKAHLEELREALDKASGVTPAAAGHIRARVGNLTSENALRISLMGTIAKVKRKRVTYGAGIEQLCDQILHGLDVQGVFRTTPGERAVSITWSDPIPADESRRITDALAKVQLGVPERVLRAELGYAEGA